MKNSIWLDKAIERKKTKNKVSKEELQMNINDFVCKLYCDCDPASYGKWLEKKFILDSMGYVSTINAKQDKGEMLIGEQINEMKSSYFNQAKVYRLANLRVWQKINNYILFLIDTEDNFKLRVFMVDKNVIYENLNFAPMDNTFNVNEGNEKVNMGTTFRKEFIEVLEQNNKLRSSNYDDLLIYAAINGNKKSQVS
jgi:hypothetical protein